MFDNYINRMQSNDGVMVDIEGCYEMLGFVPTVQRQPILLDIGGTKIF